METIDFRGHTIHKWALGASTFLAMPGRGARLMNWHLTLADGSVRDVIHWPEDADLGDMEPVRGGNPILFPFAARTFCDGEEGFWRAPDGVRRPMRRHGYARAGDFELTTVNDKGFLATFVPSEACREAYPYAYSFSVRYRFEELAFTVDLELRNDDSCPIPWSAGHHFYFTLPWHEGLERKDYHLTIPAKKAFHQDSRGALVGVKEFSQVASFADPQIVDLIHCRLKHNAVIFGPRSGEEAVEILIGPDTVPSPWATVVSWTAAEDSPFYCVEPWMGPPNSPEHKNGLHFVDPGRSEIFTVRVALS